MRGAGEKQIEMDRRLLQERILSLKKEIAAIALHRNTQRLSRMKGSIPTLGIVGYTNAGKSTLLNLLTGSNVLVEDRLFATLDTTARKMLLPNHQEIILIDTVGFIRKLPHSLVAAFRSTLEESCYTDLLIHVIDGSSSSSIKKVRSTIEVLKELGVDQKPVIPVVNKCDALSPTALEEISSIYPNPITISATQGDGIDMLMQSIEHKLSFLRETIYLQVPQNCYNIVAQIVQSGDVIASEYRGNDVLLHAQIPKTFLHKVLPFQIDPWAPGDRF